jgi:hypothetical protein
VALCSLQGLACFQEGQDTGISRSAQVSKAFILFYFIYFILFCHQLSLTVPVSCKCLPWLRPVGISSFSSVTGWLLLCLSGWSLAPNSFCLHLLHPSPSSRAWSLRALLLTPAPWSESRRLKATCPATPPPPFTLGVTRSEVRVAGCTIWESPFLKALCVFHRCVED